MMVISYVSFYMIYMIDTIILSRYYTIRNDHINDRYQKKELCMLRKSIVSVMIIVLIAMTSTTALFAQGAKEEQRITVMTSMGGTLLETFELIIGNFSEETGYAVDVEVVSDISTLLVTREQAGDLPDVVQLAKPGQMYEFVNKGKVIELDQSIVRDHSKGFVELGSVDGKLYGIFLDASVKSLIWYNPKNFADKGYTIPKTWDEMMTLSAKMEANGDTPWVFGMESGGSSGWPGSDWLEDIILRQEGVEFYDKWIRHEIPWTDPRMKRAWETFASIFKHPGYVLGGNEAVVSLGWNEAPNYLFTTPPEAMMYKQGTFVQAYIQKNNTGLVAGEDYSVFALPPIEEAKTGNVLMGAGDIIFGFSEKPGVRELLEYLASEKAQEVIAKTGQGIAVNNNVPTDIYPDPINKEAAKILKSASNFRFDGSDLMPRAIGSGSFRKGLMDFFSGKELDTILNEIEKSAVEAYK